MVVISHFFTDTVHYPFTCKCPIPAFMTVIFGAIQTLIQHLLIADFIITLYCKNNVIYYSTLGSQDGFTFITLSPGPLQSRHFPHFHEQIRSSAFSAHSMLITRDKQCTNHKIL